jgi:deoxyribodipyrimidine photo-lyase
MRYRRFDMATTPQATRQAALTALTDFLPLVPQYAARRSFVSEDNRNVSRLSPYLRRRVITEQEVVQRVLEVHSFQAAEKFIQEVVWRTYWKGWLERYPHVWSACVGSDARLRETLNEQPWGELYNCACRGETQLSFFNDWVHELVATGYLHNHARMWFASVWIFTLKLPWQLGAMFMYRHLLDGDPASNTLSWRWVAGLQTKGKSYLARADNIATYSHSRWQPKPGELAESVHAVHDDVGIVEHTAHRVEYAPLPVENYKVVTTDEDLSFEVEGDILRRAQEVALLRYQPEHNESARVTEFVRDLECDARQRFGGVEILALGEPEVASWAVTQGYKRIVVVMPPVGPNRTRVLELMRLLSAQGLQCSIYQRKWDAELHGLADKGFFPFWERVKKRIGKRDSLFYGKEPQE